MVATKQLRLAMEMDKERKARLEKMGATTKINIVLIFVYDKGGLGGVLVACEEC